MAVNNAVYNTPGDIWWDERQMMSIIRTALNPGRFGYFKRILLDELRLDPRGKRTLDVGCGGGLLAEEFAQIGCRVTGIDPAEASLAAARAHAARSGLEIDYRAGVGESLPFEDASFEIVYCCDVLEHVDDLDRVVAEIGRVLAPGGVFLYDTINRTGPSKLVMIKLFQEWNATSFMAPDLHDWRQFIKPDELRAIMVRHGLQPRDIAGLSPGANPIALFRALRQRKRGAITYAETGRRVAMRVSKDTSVMYMGYALKP